MKACETAKGLAAQGKIKREERRSDSQAFTTFKSKCDVYQGNYPIKSCEKFKSMGVDDLWKVAKDKQPCFHCLANNHQGRNCRRTKECRLNGYKGTTTDFCVNWKEKLVMKLQAGKRPRMFNVLSKLASRNR